MICCDGNGCAVALYFCGCGIMADEGELFVDGECFKVDAIINIDGIAIC